MYLRWILLSNDKYLLGTIIYKSHEWLILIIAGKLLNNKQINRRYLAIVVTIKENLRTECDETDIRLESLIGINNESIFFQKNFHKL